MRMLWLELTTHCQLACTHCYNSSGPTGDHGTMAEADWRRVIDQAADAGVGWVQFIGGEPMLYPGLPALIGHARAAGLEVEVYSNLVWVSDEMWAALAQPGVRLATSYYSDDPDEHARITGRPTLRQTTANVARALEMDIPLRAGIVEVLDGQRIIQARSLLGKMGVTNIGVDHARPFGRAATPGAEPSAEGLCGRCGRGCAVVLPDASVAPCPMARAMAMGDVRTDGLLDLLQQVGMLAEASIPGIIEDCGPSDGCKPPCEPQCKPGCDPSVKITAEEASWTGTR